MGNNFRLINNIHVEIFYHIYITTSIKFVFSRLKKVHNKRKSYTQKTPYREIFFLDFEILNYFAQNKAIFNFKDQTTVLLCRHL